MWKTLVGFAAGYVLGSRAGEKRYEQIKSVSSKVWNSDPVVKSREAAGDKAHEAFAQAKGQAKEAAKEASAAATERAHEAAENMKSKFTAMKDRGDDEIQVEAIRYDA